MAGTWLTWFGEDGGEPHRPGLSRRETPTPPGFPGVEPIAVGHSAAPDGPFRCPYEYFSGAVCRIQAPALVFPQHQCARWQSHCAQRWLQLICVKCLGHSLLAAHQQKKTLSPAD
jgi:hypothetical protein